MTDNVTAGVTADAQQPSARPGVGATPVAAAPQPSAEPARSDSRATRESPPARASGTGAARQPRGRVVGLDGIRGLAALFVVLHHCYLVSFPGYPENTGPHWTTWLMYGHLAVVVFIVLSGFSLALAPARAGWMLNGVSRFAGRRAWRILPPYWAALAFSLLIAYLVVPQPGEQVPTGRTVVVYGLLLQDIVGSPNPNGAMWSIAVEAQLYVAFPLLLLVVRRVGAAAMVATVTAVVATVGVLAPSVPTVDLLMRLTPQFAALFALGLAAAGILRAGERVWRLPWHWLAVLAAAPVVATIAVRGPVWCQAHQFWVDLALGPAVVLMLAAVTTRRARPLVWLLDTRPVRRLGMFSYSLYLVHAPIVVAINSKLVGGRVAAGLPTFWSTLALAVPVAVGGAWLFASVFEIPFQRHRSWPALRAAVRARLALVRGSSRRATARGR